MGVHAQADISAVNTGARKHKDLSVAKTRTMKRDLSTYSAEIIEKSLEDLMISLENMFTVSSETTIKNAAFMLEEVLQRAETGECQCWPCLLVFENKELIGILGQFELLGTGQPSNLGNKSYGGWSFPDYFMEPVSFQGLFAKRCADMANKCVREIMRPVDVCLNANENLSKAAYLMSKTRVNVIPVKKNGAVAGIILKDDIIKEYFNYIHAY